MEDGPNGALILLVQKVVEVELNLGNDPAQTQDPLMVVLSV